MVDIQKISRDTIGRVNEGYKFAISFLAATGSIFVMFYNYIQNYPIDENEFFFIYAIISAMIPTIVGFVFYLLIKGYSNEINNPLQINYLENFASSLYLISIYFFIILIITSTWTMIIFSYDIIENGLILGLTILIIFFIVACFFNWPMIKQLRNITNFMNYFLTLPFISYSVWVILLTAFFVTSPIIQGHITIEMENLYYKSDNQIPANIQVTGPISNLSIILLQKESDNLSEKHIISLEPNLIEQKYIYKVQTDNGLFGRSLGHGKYIVFINTTNLPPGYYELFVSRKGYWRSIEMKGFYLLNDKKE